MDVRIKDGQILSDGSHLFSGALTHREDSYDGRNDEEFEVYRLRYGHTLRPYTGSLLADNDSDKPAGSKNADIISTLDDGNTHTVALQNRIIYQDDEWSTLCLPFDVDLNDTYDTPLENTTVMELDVDGTYDGYYADPEGEYKTGFDASSGTLYLFFKEATSIKAGKPYLVKWESLGTGAEGIRAQYYNPVFNDVTINNIMQDVIISNAATFKGNYAPVPLSANDTKKLFLANNMLYYPTGSVTVKPFRAYFELTSDVPTASGAPNLVIDFGETTGVGELRTENRRIENSFYDLQGRRLNGKPTQKGIYIHNGKLEVLK